MRSRHGQRVVGPVVAAAALLIGPLPAAPLTATASADGCPDAEVVFARGTSEPPGIGRVGDAFVGSLRSRTSMNVGTYAVNYPASYNFATAAEGANDASGHIQYMIDNCPGTRLVLGGYSQGAAVIDILTAAPIGGFGFNQPLSPEAADHIAAVALFGNPSDRLGGLVPSLGPAYAERTTDLCAGGDPICSDGRSWSAHSAYVPGLTSQAAGFVAGRL
ncbi:MAG TPA: cutinase family protein [Mycobacterium sp.]|nr:cutinase family protein [Mycobacterium sp.]